jgi:general secretion pathway protein G
MSQMIVTRRANDDRGATNDDTHRSSFLIHRSGFTLLELLVVIVIIGILAAALVPNLAGRSQQAKVAAARQDLSALATALDLYEADNGSYPTSSQGLRALLLAPAGVTTWSGPYLKTGVLPVDPWDREYVYVYPSPRGATVYDLVCVGPDGKLGTDDDITPKREARKR